MCLLLDENRKRYQREINYIKKWWWCEKNQIPNERNGEYIKYKYAENKIAINKNKT
jgi:hypothetical protein